MENRTPRKDDIYWKAFVGFVSPQKQLPRPVTRQRSFEYMELSHEAGEQSQRSNSHRDYDAIEANWPTAEIVAAESAEGGLAQSDVASLIAHCDVTEDGPEVSENNNNNLAFKESFPTDLESRSSYEKREREGHILSTSSAECSDDAVELKRSGGLAAPLAFDETIQDSPFEEVDLAPSCLEAITSGKIIQQPLMDEDSFDGPELPQFVPTLSVIAEEEEESSPRRSLSGAPQLDHTQNQPLGDQSTPGDYDVTVSDDVTSARSFMSSLRRSSTIERLDEEDGDELVWQPHDFQKHLRIDDHETKSLVSSLDEEEPLPRCSSTDERDDEDLGPSKRQETSLSNHSSLVDSAYSSHEKLNAMHRSTPDLCDSIEDLQYIPVSYADTSLKRKKRRWPTFGIGDSRESLNAKVSGSSKLGTLKKRLTRKLSKRSPRPKRESPDRDEMKDPYPSSTLPRRSKSFRRTIMRVLRFRTPDADRRFLDESRPRSWSLPTWNRHTTAVAMDTEDSDVVVSELAVI